MTSLLAAEPKDWVEANYEPSILQLGRVDGKQFGMAVNASSPLMFFNVELVKQAGGNPEKMPDNWPDVIALATKIKSSGANLAGLAYNIHDWPDDWLLRSMVQQAGGNMVDASGTKVAFGDATGLQAMRYIRRFVTENGMPLIDWDQSRQQFIAGQIGLFFDTPGRLRQDTDLIGKRFTLGTAVFPIDNKEKGGLPTGGNAALVLTHDPAKQKAAWELAKYMTGPEVQTVVAETTGYLPTNKRAVGPDFLGAFYTANPNFRTITGQINRSLPWQGYSGGNPFGSGGRSGTSSTASCAVNSRRRRGLEALVKETTALIS